MQFLGRTMSESVSFFYSVDKLPTAEVQKKINIYWLIVERAELNERILCSGECSMSIT